MNADEAPGKDGALLVPPERSTKGRNTLATAMALSRWSSVNCRSKILRVLLDAGDQQTLRLGRYNLATVDGVDLGHVVRTLRAKGSACGDTQSAKSICQLLLLTGLCTYLNAVFR